MIWLLAACLLAAAGLLYSPAAIAQYRADEPGSMTYREGRPETLPRPAPPADPGVQVRGRFATAYARAGSPRIMIFWNREFSDELVPGHEDYEQFDADIEHSTTARRPWRDGAGDAIAQTDGSAHISTERRSGRRSVNPGAKGRLVSEVVDIDLEQAFHRTLQLAGVRLADRTSGIRTQGRAQSAGAGLNGQEAETDAVLKKADLTIEVTQVSDDRSPRGVSFKVVCRDVARMRLLASFLTSAEPPERPRPYVAGPSGFERARREEPGSREIGRQLGVEVMDRLSSAL